MMKNVRIAVHLLLIVALLLLAYNNTLYKHTHVLYNGQLIEHAHPYNSSSDVPNNPYSPLDNHKHSGIELLILQSIYIAGYSMMLILFLFAFLNYYIRIFRGVERDIRISFASIQYKKSRGPPFFIV